MTLPTPGNEVRVSVELPWLDKTLSPNARVHWTKKAKAAKLARMCAWGAVLAETGASPSIKSSTVNVLVTFCPPDRRRRDLDNCIASFKASNDGIADALGIDDSRFVSTYQLGSPVKGGAVHVTLRGA